jgi:hypothetical protein
MTFSTAKMRGPSGFEVAFEGPTKGRRSPVFGSRDGEVALGPLPCVSFREITPALQASNPHTGVITTYRRFNKPALGPLGDSLDDFA